jgi:hypothetical protein
VVACPTPKGSAKLNGEQSERMNYKIPEISKRRLVLRFEIFRDYGREGRSFVWA